MEEHIYCSDLARQESASLYGTAVQVDLWLLIEYPRPWKPKALIDNDFPAKVNERLANLPNEVAATSGRKLRVQFIKQGASTDRAHPRIMLADGAQSTPRLVVGELSEYSALAELTAADLLDHKLPNGKTQTDPVFLVCTNGQRDLCCARFGLPLFEALRVEYDSRIWQTTHIGGHRYAPNLVCLPDGIVYGFVQPEQGVELVQAFDTKQLSLPHLRGRACHVPAVQAAEYFLRKRDGKLSTSEYQLQKMTEYDDVSNVIFMDAKGGRHQLDVRKRQQEEAVIASCGADAKPVDCFELVKAVL